MTCELAQLPWRTWPFEGHLAKCPNHGRDGLEIAWPGSSQWSLGSWWKLKHINTGYAWQDFHVPSINHSSIRKNTMFSQQNKAFSQETNFRSLPLVNWPLQGSEGPDAELKAVDNTPLASISWVQKFLIPLRATADRSSLAITGSMPFWRAIKALASSGPIWKPLATFDAFVHSWARWRTHRNTARCSLKNQLVKNILKHGLVWFCLLLN